MSNPPSEPLSAPILHSPNLTYVLFDITDPTLLSFTSQLFNLSGATDFAPSRVRAISYSSRLTPADTFGRLSRHPAVYAVHLGPDTTTRTSRIGVINLCRRVPHVPVDLGFMLLPEFRGKGYGTEAAGRVLRYWRDELGIREICLVTGEDNKAARRVAEKVGFVDGGWVSVGEERRVVYVLPGMKRLEGEKFSFLGVKKVPEGKGDME